MTQALLSGGLPAKVLEVGFGCGYQTAVLAPFAQKIFSIERVEPLVERAKKHLKELQVRNVKLKHGDGMKGWPTQAPFDGIIVAAAPLAVPRRWSVNLAIGAGCWFRSAGRPAAAAAHHPPRQRGEAGSA